jgi:hypothetical protein
MQPANAARKVAVARSEPMMLGHRMAIAQLSDFLEAAHATISSYTNHLPEPEPTVFAALDAIRAAAVAIKAVRERR